MDLDDLKLNKLINHLKDEDLKDMVRDIIISENCMKTLQKPASSTGKYHPSFANKNWGLYYHTMLVVKNAVKICDLYLAIKRIKNEDREIIIAACILHDCFKYRDTKGKTLKFTHKEHGLSGSHIINNYFNSLSNTHRLKGYIGYKISKAVRYHMSNWCGNKNDINYVHNNQDIINEIVMMSDMLASDKRIYDFVREIM